MDIQPIITPLVEQWAQRYKTSRLQIGQGETVFRAHSTFMNRTTGDTAGKQIISSFSTQAINKHSLWEAQVSFGVQFVYSAPPWT
jgi:hypothetical protein